jgi:hypothetical protein
MNTDDTVLDHLTEQIIGGAMTVSNAFGAGFLAKASSCCATSATRARRSGASCWACHALALSAFIGVHRRLN